VCVVPRLAHFMHDLRILCYNPAESNAGNSERLRERSVATLLAYPRETNEGGWSSVKYRGLKTSSEKTRILYLRAISATFREVQLAGRRQ